MDVAIGSFRSAENALLHGCAPSNFTVSQPCLCIASWGRENVTGDLGFDKIKLSFAVQDARMNP